MNNLLLDEYPLLVMPNLATKIGLNESIILQQIHYWLEINKKTHNNYKDGYYWSYNSYEKWQEQFPFWSLSTIKRTIKKLESYGLVISGNYNKMKIDRTKWYRIDYEILEKVDTGELVPLGQNDPINESNCTNHSINMNKPIPETKTKTKSEIKSTGSFNKNSVCFSFYSLGEYFNLDDINDNVYDYISIFNEYTEKELIYSYEKWSEIISNLNEVLDTSDRKMIEDMIVNYYNCNFKEHHLYHATLPKILENRQYEENRVS